MTDPPRAKRRRKGGLGLFGSAAGEPPHGLGRSASVAGGFLAFIPHLRRTQIRPAPYRRSLVCAAKEKAHPARIASFNRSRSWLPVTFLATGHGPGPKL